MPGETTEPQSGLVTDNFKAGWRPAIGYVAALGLLYAVFLYPLFTFLCAMFMPHVTIPPLEDDGLMELVLAALGLGGMRSWEKISGVSS